MSTHTRLSVHSATDADAISPFVALVARAEREDGQRPFNDQTMLTVGRPGGPRLILAEQDDTVVGAASLANGDAEFVVSPAHRGRGIGTVILTHLLERSPGAFSVWAHGDHPAAAALAARHGLERARTLLKLRAPTPTVPRPWTRTDLTLTTFEAARDADDWVALNARTFAAHPEQGRQTRADLDARRTEPWFDAGDFLLARDDRGTLVGSCWLKVEGGEGEIYVLGVDPGRAGAGIGRSLLAAGLDRLRARRADEVTLYVEADNVSAVGLYRSEGFVDAAVDVHYRRPAIPVPRNTGI